MTQTMLLPILKTEPPDVSAGTSPLLMPGEKWRNESRNNFAVYDDAPDIHMAEAVITREGDMIAIWQIQAAGEGHTCTGLYEE